MRILALSCVLLAGIILPAGTPAFAQADSPEVASLAELPDAPQAASAGAAVAERTGSISGVVTDADGAFVGGAGVALTSGSDGKPTVTVTGADGRFSFGSVAAGDFQLVVTMEGLTAGRVAGSLRAGESLELPEMLLSVAGLQTNVDVVLSRHDQVELEVKKEETQRLLGVLPNFFVAYEWDAGPLSAGQKFELAFRTTTDPVSFAFTAATAGVQQATNSFSGYGQGLQGYGKRYGAAYADFAIGTVVGGAILPALFRQDPRYFYKGKGSVKSRALYAFSQAFVCRGDNGRTQPNYSSVLGDLAAGAASNLYYPSTDRNGWDLTLENGLLSSVFDGLGNVVEEFFFSRLTSNGPRRSGSGP